jgi:hypothetical protein
MLPARTLCAFAVAIAFVLVSNRSASGQQVSGRIIDSQSGAYVPTADVALIGLARSDTLRTISDSNGLYRFQVTSPGRYSLRASRLGYAATVTPSFELRAVESFVLDVRIAPQGIQLDPVVVISRSGIEPGRFGFDRRCALGKGICLTPDSITARKPREATDVFRAVEGLSVSRAPGSLEADVRTFQGYGCMLVFLDNNPRWIKKHDGRANRRGLVRDSSGLNAINPTWIVGVEIYRGFHEVPRELMKTMLATEIWPASGNPARDRPCGVAIVWTRAAW